MGDYIRVNEHVHIGVAVAVEDGLLVPVVRFADSKPLTVINAEVKRFRRKSESKEIATTGLGREYIHYFQSGYVRD